jgi:hypothetical protein
MRPVTRGLLVRKITLRNPRFMQSNYFSRAAIDSMKIDREPTNLGSTDKVACSCATTLSATVNAGPRTTARSISWDTACAASRVPIVASARSAAACSGTMRQIPKPAKRRHSAARAGTAAARRRRAASAASADASARRDSGIAAISTSPSISAGTSGRSVLRGEDHSPRTPASEKRSSCSSLTRS